MSIPLRELHDILQEKFPNAQIKLTDLAGDEDHYSLEMVDAVFENLPTFKKHKLVKDALSSILDSRLHSLTIKSLSAL